MWSGSTGPAPRDGMGGASAQPHTSLGIHQNGDPVNQFMPQAATIGASHFLGGMRLRCQALPRILQALASSHSHRDCAALCQPTILRLWVNSSRANHDSSFLGH